MAIKCASIFRRAHPDLKFTNRDFELAGCYPNDSLEVLERKMKVERNLAAELTDGMKAVKSHREGEVTLRMATMSFPVLPLNKDDEAIVDKLVLDRSSTASSRAQILVDDAVDLEVDEREVPKPTSIQIGLIGAMQRAHPALTQLWLQWLGIPDLEHTSFDTARSEENGLPSSRITVGTTPKYQATWTGLCDFMGLEEDAVERRQNPMHLPARAPCHQAFWSAARRRELREVDGPLEWWWRLLIMRCRGIRPASRILLTKLFGDQPGFDSALISFVNPSLKKEGRRMQDIIDGAYKQPIKVVVALRVNRKSSTEGLAFALDGDKVRTHFISTLLDLAVSKNLQE